MTSESLNQPELLERRRVGAFRQTLDGRLVECNESCAAILGYDSAEELVRLRGFEYFTESDPATIAAAIGDLQTINNVDVCMRRRNGSLLWVSMNLGVIEDEGKTLIEGVLIETTDQRVATERFEHQVTHDPITGLPNRSLFFDRLLVAMAQAQRREKKLAVAVVDLDHFDLINATFGRGLADRILKAVGNRLLDALRVEDTIARFGSDEFSILLADVDDELVIASIATPGSKVVGAQPRTRAVLGRMGSALVQRTVLPGIRDTQRGFKLFTAEAADEIFSRCRINGWGFDIEVLAIARTLGFHILEVPVHWHHEEDSRVGATAYLTTLIDVARVRRTVRKTRRGAEDDGSRQDADASHRLRVG